MDNSFSCCSSKQLISKTYDTTGRNKKLDDHTLSLRLHAEHFTLAEGHKIHRLSTDILRQVYGEFLYRFALHTVYFFDNNLGLTYL